MAHKRATHVEGSVQVHRMKRIHFSFFLEVRAEFQDVFCGAEQRPLVD